MTRSAGFAPLSPGEGWKAALRASLHGAPVEDLARTALQDELANLVAAVTDDAAAPLLSGLRVRHDGLPQAWRDNGNLMLAASDAGEVEMTNGFGGEPPAGALLLLGRSARLHKANLSGLGGLIAVGDEANLYAATISVRGPSSALVGEKTTATFAAQLDARNGGAIVVGADGMWANAVRIITDDMHAIRDMKTGRRLNGRGGRVIVGAHVWLSEQVALVGDCRIGAGAAVGMGAIVTRDLPPNSVCVGRPAKPVRRGVCWTREDDA